MAYDFNEIAENYDRLNHVMTLGMDRRWRRHAAKAASLSSDSIALDVACGTGDMIIELEKFGCHTTGIDLSKEMVSIAREKTNSATFQLADAEHMPFDSAIFDTVTCAFGIRNFVHLQQGINEMVRVLKPGGNIIILELSTPDCPLIEPFYNLYTKRVIPWLGQRIAGNKEAYTYLPNSIERFPKGEAMLSILKHAGLEARQSKFFFGVCRMYKCQK